MREKLRRPVAVAVLILLFSCIVTLFWYSDWQYNLPTPVPALYHPVNPGTRIDISAKFKPKKAGPVFLHFFNPDCPCSRFNITHFKTLAERYADKINFAVVVISSKNDYTAAGIQQRFGLTVPVLFDTSVAALCGVYSTPQAVLLNTDQLLYYRGNYNRSRYCTDEKSNYAQMAIDSLLASKREPAFDHYALTAYGCKLPGCKK